MNFEILHAELGYGELSTDGSLGYQDILGNLISVPHPDGEMIPLSAHAPSVIRIRTKGGFSVRGAMNLTAHARKSSPANFLVDEHPIGSLSDPFTITDDLLIPPGEHVLRISCGNNAGKHTIWCLSPVEEENQETSGKELAIATVDCYPPDVSPDILYPLARSVRSQGLRLEVMGVGTPYENHASAKIRRLREFVASIDSEHILFTDGRDSLLIGGSDEIIREFERFNCDFVISMESECWPIRDHGWKAMFPSCTDHRNWPNAGGWMGTKDGVLRVLDEAYRLQQEIVRGDYPDFTRTWRHLLSPVHQDDQVLLQVLYLNGSIQGDGECRIFTNVGTADRAIMDNRDYEFDHGRVQLRNTGARPAVIHFSGSACDQCRDQWAAWFHHHIVQIQ